MNDILNQTIQLGGEVRCIYGDENYSGGPLFDFTGLLNRLSSLDVFYRAGLNSAFTPFEMEEQVASNSEFEEIRRLLLDRSIFPFISCARDRNDERVIGNDGVIHYYAVVYKHHGRWLVSYLTVAQTLTIIEDMETVYNNVREQFIHNLYTMLVYHHAVFEFTDTFESPTRLADFMNYLWNDQYRYVHFHTLNGTTPVEDGSEETVVCVIGIGREEEAENHSERIDAFYVPSYIAEYMHEAVMGHFDHLKAYIEILTEEPEPEPESNEQQSTQPFVVMEDSLESFFDDSTVSNIIRNMLGDDVALNNSEVMEVLENLRLATQAVEPEVQPEETISSTGTGPEPEEQPVEEIDARLLLSENSNTYLIDESTSRFSDAVWYKEIQEADIMIAGLGGIGSWVAFLLARMKPRSIWMIDPDTVEMVNMAGQLFGKSDMGFPKTTVMSSVLATYCNYHRYLSYVSRYDVSLHGTTDIMICGFDNMRARKEYFQAWCWHLRELPDELRKNCLFIDGRLNAEEFQILCLRGDHTYHIRKYQQEWLFNDIEAEEATCSYKQTSFCANMIASYMVNLFVNHIANRCDVLIERPLPFFTYYNAETMQLKME